MAGSIYLRIGPNRVSALSANQWAPALDAHDPNPPLQLEIGIVQRYPLCIPPWKADWRVAVMSTPLGSPLALLTSTPQPPLNQYDWPNPLPKRHPVSLLTHIASMDPGTLGQAPLSQQVWANPIIKVQPTSLLTWYSSMSVDVLGQRPLVQAEQPNPIPPRYPQELRTWVSHMDPATLGQRPLVQAEQPNPIPRTYPVSLRTHISSMDPATLGQAPVVPPDFPTPRGRAVQQPENLPNLLLTTLAPTAAPAASIETALPGYARNPIENLTWCANPIVLSAPPGTPTQPIDWQLPGRAPHPVGLLTWTVNLLQTTLAPGDPVIPAKFDNPIPPSPLRDYGWYQNLLDSTLNPGDPIIPARLENPRGPAPLRDYGWYQNLLQTTLFPGDPVRAIDIPNPLGAPFPISARGHISFPNPDDIPPAPTPTPTPTPAVGGRHFPKRSNLEFIPNPRAKRPAIQTEFEQGTEFISVGDSLIQGHISADAGAELVAAGRIDAQASLDAACGLEAELETPVSGIVARSAHEAATDAGVRQLVEAYLEIDAQAKATLVPKPPTDEEIARALTRARRR